MTIIVTTHETSLRRFPFKRTPWHSSQRMFAFYLGQCKTVQGLLEQPVLNRTSFGPNTERDSVIRLLRKKLEEHYDTLTLSLVHTIRMGFHSKKNRTNDQTEEEDDTRKNANDQTKEKDDTRKNGNGADSSRKKDNGKNGNSSSSKSSKSKAAGVYSRAA